MKSLTEEQADKATAQRAELRSKDWKPSHNTKAVFEKWAPVKKGAELATTALEAARLHHTGKMNADQYRQRIDGLEREAEEAGVTEHYRAALKVQLEQLATASPEPDPAGESIRLLEQWRREVDAAFRAAVAEQMRATQAVAAAVEAEGAAKARRAELEERIAEIDKAISGLVRR